MSSSVTAKDRLDRIEESMDRVAVAVGFERIDRRLEDHDRGFEKVSGQLDKIVALAVKRFDRVDRELETTASREEVRRIMGAMDEFTRRVEISDEERLIVGHQLERLNAWVQ